MLINWIDGERTWVEVIKVDTVEAVLSNGIYYDGCVVHDRYRVVQKCGKSWDCYGSFDGAHSVFIEWNKKKVQNMVNSRWN
jgi:hypothetical protein